MTYLQRALLNHDLQTLSALEWESCFNKVLFPLLAKLLQPIGGQTNGALEETRVRAATLVQKVKKSTLVQNFEIFSSEGFI